MNPLPYEIIGMILETAMASVGHFTNQSDCNHMAGFLTQAKMNLLCLMGLFKNLHHYHHHHCRVNQNAHTALSGMRTRQLWNESLQGWGYNFFHSCLSRPKNVHAKALPDPPPPPPPLSQV